MKTFQKIDSPFRRDPENPRLLSDQWRNPTIGMLAGFPIWEATEKLDGTNIRIGWDGYRITFGGRTDNADTSKVLLDALDATFRADGIEEWFEEKFPVGPNGESPEVVLYGEGVGPGSVKGASKYAKESSFIGFDVSVGEKYLAPSSVREIFKILGVPTAPVLAENVTLDSLIDTVRGGLTSTYGDFVAEGVVARTVESLYDQRGSRLIVKLKPENLPSLPGAE